MSHTPKGWRDALCGTAGQNSPTPADITPEGKGHHKRQLTPARALEIFMLRPQLKNPGQLRRSSMVHCKTIAPQFGVSPKTVREIWAGRAWARATRKEWTKEEIATGAVSSFSRMMRADSAGGASSDTSHPGALGPAAPPRQDHPPMLHAAPLLPPNNGAARSLPALLAAARSGSELSNAPQQVSSGLQTAQPAWGSGAATFVPTQDLESAIRSLQAKLAQLEAKRQAQQHHQRQQQQHRRQRDQRQSLQLEVRHFIQQSMLQQLHATEKAVSAMGGKQSLVVGFPL